MVRSTLSVRFERVRSHGLWLVLAISLLASFGGSTSEFRFSSALAAIPQTITTFTLTGIVRSQNSQVVSSVRISLADENSLPVYQGFVESTGRFTIKGLRQGRYTLRVETTGSPYEEYSQQLELQSLRQFGGNEMIPVDIILKYRKGSDPSARAGSVFAQDVPKPARTEYDRAAKELKSNRNESAIASLKKALEAFPDYFDAMEMLGTEYVKGNQHELALPLLTRAIEINKSAPKSLYALGVAYLRLSQLSDSIGVLEKSARLEPANPNTQMMLGLAYGNSGDADKSEAAFRKALQLGGPAAAEAHYYLTGLYNRQEQYRKAWQELELYLRESRNVKDPAQIKAMIAKLKDREKTQLSRPNGSPAAESPVMASASRPAAAGSPAVLPNVGSDAVNSSADHNMTEAGEVRPPETKSAPNTTTIGPVPPLPPEYVELLRQTEATGFAIHAKLLDYTYQLKKTHRVLNDRGNPTHSQEQVFEAYPISGEHVLILLTRNGQDSKTLSEDRKTAARQLEEATRKGTGEGEVKGAAKESAGYLTAGVTGVYQGRSGYVSVDVLKILQSCEFFSPRSETLDGRDMVALSFRHRAGAKLAANHAYIASLVGTLWIDRADAVVARLEGWPLTAAAFDLVQSTAPRDEAALIYQQSRQPDGSWFPSVIRMNAGGRTDLFDGLNWDVVFEFSNYQRFNTSASEKLNEPPSRKP